MTINQSTPLNDIARAIVRDWGLATTIGTEIFRALTDGPTRPQHDPGQLWWIVACQPKGEPIKLRGPFRGRLTARRFLGWCKQEGTKAAAYGPVSTHVMRLLGVSHPLVSRGILGEP